MPANKYALLRYRIIDKCIGNKFRPYPTKEDLRLACEEALFNSNHERVSESTIEKDLFAMRNESGLGYHAPIKFSREFNGYYYTDPEYSINDLPLNDEDIEAIKFAANTLSQFKHLGVFNQFGSAIDKLIGRVSISNNIEDKSIDRYVQFEDSPPALGTEHLSPILEAIKLKCEVLMTYKSFMVGVENIRTFHPYLLKEYRNRWYTIGLDKKDYKIKTFALDRITQIRHTEAPFKVLESFNRESFFESTIGITTTEKQAQEVTLQFNQQQANYIRTQPLHHSQQVLNDGEFLTVTYKLYVTPELVMQILAFGSKVKVIAPKELQEKIKTEIENSIRQYNE